MLRNGNILVFHLRFAIRHSVFDIRKERAGAVTRAHFNYAPTRLNCPRCAWTADISPFAFNFPFALFSLLLFLAKRSKTKFNLNFVRICFDYLHESFLNIMLLIFWVLKKVWIYFFCIWLLWSIWLYFFIKNNFVKH